MGVRSVNRSNAHFDLTASSIGSRLSLTGNGDDDVDPCVCIHLPWRFTRPFNVTALQDRWICFSHRVSSITKAGATKIAIIVARANHLPPLQNRGQSCHNQNRFGKTAT
jgi:hypothetical protein